MNNEDFSENFRNEVGRVLNKALKNNDSVVDIRERPAPDPLLISDFETARDIVKRLVTDYHPNLVSANFVFLCRNRAQKHGGHKVPGVMKKASPIERHLGGSYFAKGEEADFIMIIALDAWNELRDSQREALIDHLLTRCVAVEDEKTGAMKYSIRSPNVQEFPEIADRHGTWTPELTELAEGLRK